MKLILLFCLLLTGCRTYNYRRVEPDGTIVKARVLVFFSNTELDYFKANLGTNRTEFVLRGAKAELDSDSIKAISEGVTKAVIEALKKP